MTREMGNQQPLHRTMVSYRNTATATANHTPAPKMEIEMFNKTSWTLRLLLHTRKDFIYTRFKYLRHTYT